MLSASIAILQLLVCFQLPLRAKGGKMKTHAANSRAPPHRWRRDLASLEAVPPAMMEGATSGNLNWRSSSAWFNLVTALISEKMN
jgi:hypothetical protein